MTQIAQNQHLKLSVWILIQGEPQIDTKESI